MPSIEGGILSTTLIRVKRAARDDAAFSTAANIG
jgi:hypothetical protein